MRILYSNTVYWLFWIGYSTKHSIILPKFQDWTNFRLEEFKAEGHNANSKHIISCLTFAKRALLMRSLSLRSAAFLGRLWMSLKRSCDSASNRRLRSKCINKIVNYQISFSKMKMETYWWCSAVVWRRSRWRNMLFSDLLASLSICSSFDEWMNEWMSRIIWVSLLQQLT